MAWGRRSRARLFERLGHTRPNEVEWWPEVQDGLRRNYSITDISKALQFSERRVRQIIATGRAPDSEIPRRQVKEEDQPLIDWSVDAFAAFFERFSGKKFMPHFRPWVEAFLRERNLILNVPPRHAKSTIFSLWLPIWLICRDVNVQIILVSKTGGFARTWARGIADQLTLNQDLIEAFGPFAPDVRGKIPWKPNSGELMVVGRTRDTKGPQLTIQSRGAMQQILGMEADFVIIDDPTDQGVAREEVARKHELTWLREQVLTRLQPGGRAAVIMQRVHMNDLSGTLSAQMVEFGARKGSPLWHLERYPAVLNWDTQEVLWPAEYDEAGNHISGWSFEELMASYERVGGREAFETLYQQNPMPEGGSTFDPAHIEASRVDRPGWQGVRSVDNVSKVSRVLSLDPSPSQYNGWVLGDLHFNRENFRFDVMGAWRTKAGSLSALMADVIRVLDEYKPDYFIFEESGFGRWFYDDPAYYRVKDQVSFVRHKTTGISKHHTEYGFRSMAGDFEMNRITLPAGDQVGRDMTDELTRELVTWPDGQLDDIGMALWFIKYNWLKLRPRMEFTGRIKGTPEVTIGWRQKYTEKEDMYAKVKRLREAAMREDTPDGTRNFNV